MCGVLTDHNADDNAVDHVHQLGYHVRDVHRQHNGHILRDYNTNNDSDHHHHRHHIANNNQVHHVHVHGNFDTVC